MNSKPLQKSASQRFRDILTSVLHLHICLSKQLVRAYSATVPVGSRAIPIRPRPISMPSSIISLEIYILITYEMVIPLTSTFSFEIFRKF